MLVDVDEMVSRVPKSVMKVPECLEFQYIGNGKNTGIS